MKIAYKPEKLNISVKPKLFAAGQRSLAVVDHNNTVINHLFSFIQKMVFFHSQRKTISIQ